MSIEIRLHEDWPANGYDLVLFRGIRERREEYLYEDVNGEYGWRQYDNETMGHGLEAPWTISKKAAQQLADDLWAAGIRPTEGIGSAGSLMATQQHLKDMRRIAFGKLGLEEPQVK